MVQFQSGRGAARPGGSFGVPSEVQEAAERARAAAKREKAGADPAATTEPSEDAAGPEAIPPQAADEGWGLEATEELPTDETAKKVDPVQQLKTLGVELTEDDVQRLVFKGYLDKEVVVFKKPELKATLHTLTAEEYDAVDELLAEELETVKMTREGVSVRRSMWTLSFGITHLNGRFLRDLQKEGALTKEGLDLKKKAKLYRETLSQMWPAAIQALLDAHSTYTVATNLLIRGDSPFLERA